MPPTLADRPAAPTRDHLLDVAEELIQTRGYNGFSYRDLADRTGIRTASIHYHFPAKGDLGREVVVRQRQRLADRLAEIDAAAADAADRVRRFGGLFADTLAQGGRMCLCGMLAAERGTLPAAVTAEVEAYFAAAEAWLARTVRDGVRRGELAAAGPAPRLARLAVATLEGAMLVARLTGDPARLTEAVAAVVATVRGRPTP